MQARAETDRQLTPAQRGTAAPGLLQRMLRCKTPTRQAQNQRVDNVEREREAGCSCDGGALIASTGGM